ncbi:1961_t:CDS:2, partial [Ambispora leptoticha]
RFFIHNYPNNARIEACYESNGQLYYSYYNVISLGNYPANPKLTQKTRNHMPQYLVSDNYIVETEVAKKILKCKTNYVVGSKICYVISWKEGRTEWSINSTKSSTEVINIFLQKINQKTSKLSGPRVFGFDIKPLHKARLQIEYTCSKTNKRNRPLEDITSPSQQNKRLNTFGKDAQNAISQLITKHKLTDLSGKPIVSMRHINFNFKKEQVKIKFSDSNTQTELDSVVRACDEALLGHDGYRHLAAVAPTLFHEYLVADRRNKINEIMKNKIYIQSFNIDNKQFNMENSINESIDDISISNQDRGNGVYRSISTLLKVLIPIWKSGENPTIISGDILYLKLG